MSKYTNLVSEILKRSEEKKIFNLAKHEWKLDYTTRSPGSVCLCKHHPISECCHISNKKNCQN